LTFQITTAIIDKKEITMSSSKRWIWEQEKYPNFTFNDKIINPLIQKAALMQGYLIAFTSFLNGEELKRKQLEVLTDEAISTSAIEGEHLNRDSVRASIRKKLGLLNLREAATDPKTDYLIDILVDANTNYDQALDIERIFGWHNALFPTGYSGFSKINVATFRGEEPMEVVSGGIGQETIHYVAPPRDQLEDELDELLRWFNSTEETIVKAAIAHLWFVVIHPLDDGNGRISRAVADLVLSKIERSKVSKLYSMSSAINKNKKSYYDILDETTGFKRQQNSALDITKWIEWFLNTLIIALTDAQDSLKYILQKTAFWDEHRDTQLNARQIKVLNKVLDKGVDNYEGGLNNRKYVAIAKTSSATATRDLKDLLNRGCIKLKEGTTGKSSSYIVVVPNSL